MPEQSIVTPLTCGAPLRIGKTARAGEQRRRHREAEGLGGLEIDRHLEFRGAPCVCVQNSTVEKFCILSCSATEGGHGQGAID
jgi:hypothetical protein